MFISEHITCERESDTTTTELINMYVSNIVNKELMILWVISGVINEHIYHTPRFFKN